ncbi:MAG: site-2 protease family protein, partial [Anaerolineales bacterium]|nr:site-2 protease family protein [Anaerolineales bacterium]
RSTISLGRILGIPIGVDYSWFLIFALLTWSLATSYFPLEFKNWAVAQYWIVGAATTILMFVSVLLHELGHSVVALRYKIPVRSITLFIFGGVAQIGSEPPSAIAEFWIAIAGPITSFALAIFFRLLQSMVSGFAPLLAIAEYLAYINGTLGLFNLIPGFPLDGGRVFRAFIWGTTHNLRRATLIAANVGRFIAYGFIMLGVWQVFNGNFGNGLWIAFIGWFLENAASAQIHQQTIHDVLAGHHVADAMRRDYASILPNTTLEQLINKHILGNGQRSLVVKQDESVAGLLTLHNVKAIPASDWATKTAAQVMIPVADMKWIRPDAELADALGEMDRDGVNQLPVMERDQMLGVSGRDDVISFLRTVSEFSHH